MSRRKRGDIEGEWYDIFVKWSKSDREAALKVLGTLHRALPDTEKAKPNAGQLKLVGE